MRTLSVMPSPFGWCNDGYHHLCHRQYTNPTTEITRYCQCSLPGCPCGANPREARRAA